MFQRFSCICFQFKPPCFDALGVLEPNLLRYNLNSLVLKEIQAVSAQSLMSFILEQFLKVQEFADEIFTNRDIFEVLKIGIIITNWFG